MTKGQVAMLEVRRRVLRREATRMWSESKVDVELALQSLRISLTNSSLRSFARHSSQGRFSDVKSHFKRIWSERKDIFGENHLQTVKSYENLALAYSEIGELDESLKAYKDIYDLCGKAFGESSVKTIEMLDNISLVLLQQENYEAALEISKNASNWYRTEVRRDGEDGQKNNSNSNLLVHLVRGGSQAYAQGHYGSGRGVLPDGRLPTGDILLH